jgi:molybdenum cofactor synthesis domain-containing protein
MKAVIVTVGNEILKGKTINTNFSYLGKMLTYSGYDVIKGIIVRDILKEISEAFKEAFYIGDLIISSGGLGPTYDDMTIKGFTDAFGLRIVENRNALNMILGRTGSMTPEREKMAMLPENSIPLQNNAGTAPGVYIEISGKVFILLPGVPREVESIMEGIKEKIKVKGFHYIDKSMNSYNVKESLIAPLITRLMKKYGDQAYIKTHPKIDDNGHPWVEIEVSASGTDKEEIEKLASSILKEISDEISKNGYM